MDSTVDVHDYFKDYTGLDTHAEGMFMYYKDVHQSRIRINYTYYNSIELFRRICRWYQEIDPDGVLFDYSVIDDGSQKFPITDFLDEIPEQWSVYRINKDHGWNNEGARNCLMKATKNQWNLMLDSDWVITKNNLSRIHANISFLDRSIVYYPGNYGHGVGRNSYLCTKEEFWERGGYDQAFIGYHGNDYSFLRYHYKYNYGDFFRFARIVDDVVDEKEKDRFTNVKIFHDHMKDLEEQGFGHRNPEDKQDFIWTDEEAHKRHWKTINYQQVR